MKHVIDNEKWKIMSYNRDISTFDDNDGPVRFYRNTAGQKSEIRQALNVEAFLQLDDEAIAELWNHYALDISLPESLM